MGNGNADNLITRILSEAGETASEIRREAEASCSKIAEQCNEKIADLHAQQERERVRTAQSIVDGYRIRAELDGRKEALADKRSVLDHAFELVYNELVGLDETRRSALYLRLLNTEAKSGDRVSPAPSDRMAVLSAISGLPFEVVVSDTDAEIDGGFILYGNGYEKNCSLRSVLNELREAEETNVAKILFR